MRRCIISTTLPALTGTCTWDQHRITPVCLNKHAVKFKHSVDTVLYIIMCSRYHSLSLFFPILACFRGDHHQATAFSLTSSGRAISCTSPGQAKALKISPWDDHSPGADRNTNANTQPSLGDYVQGVHGGKYQFEDAGGATFAGRQFAEALYSSDPNEGNLEESTTNGDSNEPLPSWVQKMGTSAKLGPLVPLQHFPILSLCWSTPTATTTVSIRNDERSWEFFYSKIVVVGIDGLVVDAESILCHDQQQQQQQQEQQQDPQRIVLQVTPANGQLAPRGGSSNICDPTKPYSDTAEIQISANSERIMPNEDTTLLLVIGTEAEIWKYWLQWV